MEAMKHLPSVSNYNTPDTKCKDVDAKNQSVLTKKTRNEEQPLKIVKSK